MVQGFIQTISILGVATPIQFKQRKIYYILLLQRHIFLFFLNKINQIKKKPTRVAYQNRKLLFYLFFSVAKCSGTGTDLYTQCVRKVLRSFSQEMVK